MTISYRIFIYGFGLCLAFLGLTDNKSLMYIVGQQDDGKLVVWLILLTSIVGLVDTGANYHVRRLPWLRNHRHFILCSLAFCLLAQIFVGSAYVRSLGVIIFYLWPGLFTLAVALFDARKRGRESCGSV